jgi:hypothetical protein
MQTHESYDRTHAAAESSERGFGLVFAVACALVAAWQWWHGRGEVAAWWLGGAAIFAALAFFWTAPLAPLNRLWARLGRLLHGIVNPVLMGAMFVLAVIPMGLVLRLFGKDLLRLRRDPAAATYWIDRDPSTRTDAMKDQF